jgi:hypothetical protein
MLPEQAIKYKPYVEPIILSEDLIEDVKRINEQGNPHGQSPSSCFTITCMAAELLRWRAFAKGDKYEQ